MGRLKILIAIVGILVVGGTGDLALSALLGHRYPTSWTKHERARLAGSPLCASDGCPSKAAV